MYFSIDYNNQNSGKNTILEGETQTTTLKEGSNIYCKWKEGLCFTYSLYDLLYFYNGKLCYVECDGEWSFIGLEDKFNTTIRENMPLAFGVTNKRKIVKIIENDEFLDFCCKYNKCTIDKSKEDYDYLKSACRFTMINNPEETYEFALKCFKIKDDRDKSYFNLEKIQRKYSSNLYYPLSTINIPKLLEKDYLFSEVDYWQNRKDMINMYNDFISLIEKSTDLNKYKIDSLIDTLHMKYQNLLVDDLLWHLSIIYGNFFKTNGNIVLAILSNKEEFVTKIKKYIQLKFNS